MTAQPSTGEQFGPAASGGEGESITTAPRMTGYPTITMSYNTSFGAQSSGTDNKGARQ